MAMLYQSSIIQASENMLKNNKKRSLSPMPFPGIDFTKGFDIEKFVIKRQVSLPKQDEVVDDTQQDKSTDCWTPDLGPTPPLATDPQSSGFFKRISSHSLNLSVQYCITPDLGPAPTPVPTTDPKDAELKASDKSLLAIFVSYQNLQDVSNHPTPPLKRNNRSRTNSDGWGQYDELQSPGVIQRKGLDLKSMQNQVNADALEYKLKLARQYSAGTNEELQKMEAVFQNRDMIELCKTPPLSPEKKPTPPNTTK